VQDRVVDDAHTAGADRAHGQLVLAGHGQLACHDDVQWGAQCAGDFGGHRYTAARQAQHHGTQCGQMLHMLGQPTPGLAAIREIHVWLHADR
jgi:hypothetical protein